MKKLMMAVGACVCALGMFVGNDASAGLLPPGYTILEYVEANGTQAINSFYNATTNTRFDLRFQVGDNINDWQAGFFGTESWGGRWSFDNCYGRLRYWEKAILAGASRNDYFASIGQGYGSISNLNTGAFGRIAITTGSNTINLFRSAWGYGRFRLYDLQIYDGAEKVRDLLPCLTPLGTVGLYDSVSNVFWTCNNSASAALIAGPEGHVNALSVTSTHPQYGEPTCTQQTGYGAFLMADGETATVTMPETTISTPIADMQLLGWRLVVTAADGSVTTNESVAATFDTCTYVHAKGCKATLLWRWKRGHRITATAGEGLSVTCSPTSFDEGETVTVRFTVRETTGRFVGWEGAGVPDRYRFSTNFTMSVSEGFAVRAQSATNILYATADGEGDGASGAAAAPLQRALDLARATPGSMVCAMAGLYGIATDHTPFQITNTVAPFLLSGGYTGAGFEKGGETLLARTDSSVQTRILDCSAATFCAEGLVISNGWSKGSGETATYRHGQGVRLTDDCMAQFEGCAFRNNSDTTLDDQTYCGGAIGAKGGTLIVRDCLFWKNRLYGNSGNVRGGGGAIGADQTALYVSDTQFVSNYLQSIHKRYLHGGAMRIMSAPDVEIANCTFDGNYVRHSTGAGNYTSSQQLHNEGAGGALTVENCPRVTIRDSLFDANWNGSVDFTYPLHPFGGTIRMNDSNVSILRTVVRRGGLSDQVITSDLGKYTCGGIDLVGGTLAMTNVLVADTWTAWAIGNKGGTISAKNCTVTGVRGYGWTGRPASAYVAYSDTTVISDSKASFADCVFWNNAGGDYNVPVNKEPVFAACLAQAQQPGVGNVTCDPLFEDEYFHVKSAAGNYAGGYFDGGSWVTTNTVTSRAVDLDPVRAVLATEPQPNGLHENAGYDGNTALASKSAVAEPPVVGDELGMVAYPDVSGEDGVFTFYGDVTGEDDAAVPVTFVWDLEDRGTASVADWAHAIDCGNHAPWTGVTASTGFEFEGTVAYRFVADGGAAGLKWSNPVRQFTIAVLPTLAYDSDTLPVTHVYRASARVNLNLVSNGGADTTVTVTYQPADGSSDPVTVQALSGTTVPVGAFGVDLSGLALDTEYRVYATAANMMGEVSTPEQTFTTRKAGDVLTLCVAETPSGYGDGRSWAHPVDFVTALAAATGAADEIRVQQGRYVVNELVSGTRLSNRTLTIRGGYGTDGTPYAGQTVFTASDVNQVNSRIFRFSGCTVLIDSITFTNGRNGDRNDSYGQAIGCYDSTSLTVTNCTFTENGNFALANDSQFNGGAIGAKGGTLTVLDCQFADNSIHAGDSNVRPLGGAIGATDSATLVVRNCGFHRNYGQMVHGRGFGGGAIGVMSCAQLSVESCLFTTNYMQPGNPCYGGTQTWAGPYGGTLYVYNTPTTLKNLTIDGSWTHYGEQAANGWDFGGTFYFEGSVVGGENIAIWHAGESTYKDSENAGKIASGSITVRSGTVALTNVLDAASGRGALISHLGGALEIVNGTFVDAQGRCAETIAAGAQKGAVYSQYTAATDGSAIFRNCICWNNAAGFRSHASDKIALDVSYSDIEGAADAAKHVIDADPRLYAPTKARAYHLRAGSPCAGTGDATGWPKGATDLDGRPRTRGSTIDMGCYSFNAPGFMLMLK